VVAVDLEHLNACALGSSDMFLATPSRSTVSRQLKEALSISVETDSVMMTNRGDVAYVLIARRHMPNEQELRSICDRLYSGVVSRFAKQLPKAVVSLGVGPPVESLTRVSDSYEEAQRALTIGRRLWGSGSRVVLSSDLGVFRWVLSTPESAVYVSKFWDRLEAYDTEHGTALALTCATFLDRFGRVRSTAKELYIHPHTLEYRLRRVQEITQIDLDDPNFRLLVHLEHKIRHV
jgi:purine catabolism regulator